jgi:hypothetical protein
MITTDQIAHREFQHVAENQSSPAHLTPTRLSAGHLLGWVGLNFKRLLVVGILTLSLNAFAANPTITDAGQFIKFVGKQAVTSEVEDDDIIYVSKNAITLFQSTKRNVNITLSNGSLSFAFETKEQATAFLAQIVAFCKK